MREIIKSILRESKQVGVLYHFTNFDRAAQILRNNKLEGAQQEPNYISFTRNINLFKEYNRRSFEYDIVFVIDGNKLSNNHKIEPFNYFGSDQDKGGLGNAGDLSSFELNMKHRKYDEMEERIMGDEVNNILNYIIEIIIDVNYKLTDYEEKYYNTIRYIAVRNNIPITMKKLS